MFSAQDRRWVHKLSGGMVVLSTLGVVACIPSTILSDSQLPPAPLLHGLVLGWAASVSFLSVSGTVLALRHRQTQPRERTLFLVSAFSNLLSALIAVSSLPPHTLSDAMVRVVLSVSIASACFVADPATVETRKRRRPPRTVPSHCTPRHIFPFCAGVPFLLLACYTGVFVDRAAFAALAATKPPLLPALLYGDVINGLCAGIGAFTVTMKDRKVLSAKNERGIIAASSGVSISMFVGLLCATLWNGFV